MPEPPGLVVKKGTKRLAVFERPGPSSSTQISSRRSGAGKALPADADAAAGFAHGVDGVAQQVDEHLLELIAVPVDGSFGPRGNLDVGRVSRADDAVDDGRRCRAARAWAAAAWPAGRRR